MFRDHAGAVCQSGSGTSRGCICSAIMLELFVNRGLAPLGVYMFRYHAGAVCQSGSGTSKGCTCSAIMLELFVNLGLAPLGAVYVPLSSWSCLSNWVWHL